MAARIGSLGSVLPVALAEPDGLIVTTDGRYVRVIECDRVPNTITADPSELGRIEDCFAHLCRIIPDRQGLTILAQTDPVPIDDALAADVRAAKIAAARDQLAGQPDARGRAHATDGGHPSNGPRRRRRRAAGRRGAVVGRRALPAGDRRQPRAAARELGRRPRPDVVGDPRRGCDREPAARRPGRRRPAPRGDRHLAAGRHPGARAAVGAPSPRRRAHRARAEAAPRAARRHLRGRGRRPGSRRPPSCATGRSRRSASTRAAGIDIGEHPAWLRHDDGTLEETIHLATPPLATDPSWLAHLLSCPLPATLAVHIAVGVRSREKHRQRRRWQRLRAAVRYKERRDRLVGSDEEDALEEAAVMDAELAAQVGATVYEVGVYCSIRDPTGNAESFDRIVKQTCSDFHALTNARVVRGRHLALQGFTATLPLGVDPLRATRRYAQRNIAHCVPLTSSRCGCPDGLILGTADPGGTIERLDPYDRQFATTLTLIVGKGGGGKTVTSILLACRFIAQGGRIYITDRSSTPDDRGDSTGTGHYDTLLSLIPGGRRVQLGTAHGAVICPWDVPDVEHVPDQKVEFLLALHALLIGEAHDAEGLVRTLDADEEALLRDAITAVYKRCADSRERPREQLLIDALHDRQQSGQLTGANADKLQSLLLRLGPYGQDGTLAHIADRRTTVDEDAPLVLFDFTGLSDRLAPALTLAVADYVEWHVHRLRRARVAGELDGHGPWAGKSQLIIEEGWKPLSSPAAGAWLNEYARRARHYALWLTFITQFFRDFDSEQGRSMLSNHAVALCLPNERRDLEHARDSLALTDTDIAEITSLPSQKGSYSTLYMISKRGRGAIRIAPGAPEYWIASSNPELDQPLRHAALRETGGDPWKALTRLCDPAWQERQRQPQGVER